MDPSSLASFAAVPFRCCVLCRRAVPLSAHFFFFFALSTVPACGSPSARPFDLLPRPTCSSDLNSLFRFASVSLSLVPLARILLSRLPPSPLACLSPILFLRRSLPSRPLMVSFAVPAGQAPGLALGNGPPSWPFSTTNHEPPPQESSCPTPCTFLDLISSPLHHNTINTPLTGLDALPSRPFSRAKHEPPPQENPHLIPRMFVQPTPSSLQHETMNARYVGHRSSLRRRVTTTPVSSLAPPSPWPSSAPSVGSPNDLHELQPAPQGPRSLVQEELSGERILGFHHPVSSYGLFAVRRPSAPSKYQVCLIISFVRVC